MNRSNLLIVLGFGMWAVLAAMTTTYSAVTGNWGETGSFIVATLIVVALIAVLSWILR